MNSRNKGKRIEREAVAYLRSLGFASARRTAQVRGKNDGAPDIECAELRGVHIEVKGNERIQVGSRDWRDAVNQVKRDSNGGEWVLLWRRKSLPWCLTCDVRGHSVTFCDDDDIREVMIAHAFRAAHRKK